MTLVHGTAVDLSRPGVRRWDGRAGTRVAVGTHDRFALGSARLGVCLLPVLTPRGPANLTPVDLALAIAVGTLLLWAAYTRARLSAPYRIGVATMLAAGLISGLAGSWPGLALMSVMQDVFLFAWAATVATLLRDAPAVAALLRTWVWSAAAWAIAFVATTTRTAATAGAEATRVDFTFGDQNAAGLYFVLSLLIMVATGVPRPRTARVAIGAVFLLAVMYTGSLGAISGVLLGVATALVLGVRDRRGASAAVALSGALMLAVVSVIVLVQRNHLIDAAHNSSNSLIRNSFGREAQSSSERAILRAESLQLWRSSDLIGGGPATTKDQLRAKQSPYPKEAHNDWLATLIERGVLGALGLLLLFLELVLRGHRTWARSRLEGPLRRVLIRPAFLSGGLVCVLAFSLTHEVLHDRTVWTLFGVVAAAAFITHTDNEGIRGT